MRSFILLFIIFFVTGVSSAADLVVYAGAGLIKPMEDISSRFEQSRQVSVHVHYGGSGELFGMLAMGKPCDVLIPGAAKYTADALKNGWIDEKTIRHVVYHVPVIAVPAGNPADIKNLEDLSGPKVRIALGDPNGPAIGKTAKSILVRNNIFDAVKSRTRVWTPTVNQLLIYIVMKQVDAAIIWEDLVSWPGNRDKIQVIPIPEKQNLIKTIPTSVTVHGMKNPLAGRFNDCVTSPESLVIWKEWGFKPCGK